MNYRISRAAERFWSLVGFEEPFPRALEAPIALACQVAIVQRRSLTPGDITHWLSQSGIHIRALAPERSLKGCLIAHRGHGFIFINDSLSPDELRLTLAHELAHYLLHYLWPRERTIEHFGHCIRAVLDGERVATPAEKLSGILNGIPLGTCYHLMDRDFASGLLSAETQSHEIEADLLAFELLAPMREVRRLKTRNREHALIKDFGLPPWAAKAWASQITARSSRNRFIASLRAAAERK